jgi:hypothetical protein
MPGQDDIIARIERFNESRGGGVVVERRKGGYTLLLEATGAPIARLKPVDDSDRMRVLYWSYRDRWDDVGPFGGIILPLDKALEFIAREPVFWTWT